jgi:hypothetical protein
MAAMQLEAIATGPRHSVVFQVKENIDACGGAILDHKQFSNHLLRLSLEIRRGRLNDMVTNLEAAGLTWSHQSVERIASLSSGPPDDVITGTLAIRFVSDEPGLRVPVPAIPG